VSAVRLQKFLAEAGFGSRRACETLISGGQVTVNGQVVTTLGARVVPERDRVTCAGRPVVAERKVYVALHKPAGYLCTGRDTHNRRTVFDLLPRSLGRLFTVGRLDKDTEGLLLLTNDGTFGLRLSHPRYKMPKQYWVEVRGVPTAETLRRLRKGVVSDGETLRAETISQVRPLGETTELRLRLMEGRKRQIRRMMEAVGHPVQRLVRLSVGPFTLGDLKPGQWRLLAYEEVRHVLQS
jgi:23S rRNA pseudouridine2605 synthase